MGAFFRLLPHLLFLGQLIAQFLKFLLDRGIIRRFIFIRNPKAVTVADELLRQLTPTTSFDAGEVNNTLLEFPLFGCHANPVNIEEFYARWNAGEEMLIMLMTIFKVTVKVNGTPIKSVHILRQDLVDEFKANPDIFLVEEVQVVKVTTQTDGGSVYARIQTVSMSEAIPVDDATFDPALGGGVTAFVAAIRALISEEAAPTEPL